MSTVAEIERAISKLSLPERWELLSRFNNELQDDWDRQLKEDLKAGNLDDFLGEARADIAAVSCSKQQC